jgi:hypothetical protein
VNYYVLAWMIGAVLTFAYAMWRCRDSVERDALLDTLGLGFVWWLAFWPLVLAWLVVTHWRRRKAAE